MEIRVMARRGEGLRAIARQVRCSRNTVRRYLRNEAAKRYRPRAPRPCKLDEHKSYLAERVRQAIPRWIPAPVLLRDSGSRLQRGFKYPQGLVGTPEERRTGACGSV